MSKEPTLVILAAGMGSRFGGLKQMTAVDDFGHAIIDFSLYDAYRAGFRRLVFVIKREIEESFRAFIGRRMEKYFEVKYVCQQLDVLPEGYTVPEGRVKPWGTGHAVLCCRGAIDAPFAVINADDFYGRTAYETLFGFLSGEREKGEQAMVAYMLKNTLTENGSVARGVCGVESGYLASVTERTKIVKRGAGAAFTEDGESWQELSGDALVSMNCWGFGPELPDELYERFPAWLDSALRDDPRKAEFFLPTEVNALIGEGRARVRVLGCTETWHGITYREDLQSVVDAIATMRAEGLYPERLLD